MLKPSQNVFRSPDLSTTLHIGRIKDPSSFRMPNKKVQIFLSSIAAFSFRCAFACGYTANNKLQEIFDKKTRAARVQKSEDQIMSGIEKNPQNINEYISEAKALSISMQQDINNKRDEIEEAMQKKGKRKKKKRLGMKIDY